MPETLFLPLALLFSLPGDQSQVPLWRDLVEGEDPATVQAKLERMEEVDRVKTKMRRGELREQDINMHDDGVMVFDVGFAVRTEYQNLELKKVQLASDQICANASYEFGAKLSGALSEKYPETVRPMVDEYAFSSASFAANPYATETLTSIYSDGETVAVMSVEFFRTDPPAYVGGGALARSLYQIARSTYEAQAARCGGTGTRTAQVRVTYISAAGLQELSEEAADEAQTKTEEAKSNL